ncbi:hypothetical protein MUK42_09786 [Musa troglodytarum]|uniref:Uncharacterized protein n=1 Tax=Musa troglodytarum TaxID=320322 RepID=A0A9E7JKN8_9LILI|nr:hypothetical protein MUK42_09786 [Musa troglodytarum]
MRKHSSRNKGRWSLAILSKIEVNGNLQEQHEVPFSASKEQQFCSNHSWAFSEPWAPRNPTHGAAKALAEDGDDCSADFSYMLTFQTGIGRWIYTYRRFCFLFDELSETTHLRADSKSVMRHQHLCQASKLVVSPLFQDPDTPWRKQTGYHLFFFLAADDMTMDIIVADGRTRQVELLHLFGKRGTSASKRDEAHVSGFPARPGPARPSCHESRADGRFFVRMPRCIRLSVETLFCSPTWSSSSPRHMVVLFQESPPHGFLKEEENPSGFHRSLPVVRISPPLSRIHVGGFAFFGFFRGKWWSWFGGRAQKQAPGAWLIQCGDYDRDLYREDPLESEGVADNLHETPPENFANLEGVVRKMYNQETEDSSALFSSNIQVVLCNLLLMPLFFTIGLRALSGGLF